MSGDAQLLNNVHVRRAVPDDAPTLLQLARSAYQQYVAAEGSEPEPMKVDYLVTIQKGDTWVACSKLGIVGYLVLDAQPEYLLLDNIAVSDDVRGRGVGGSLMEFAECRARELGLAEIRLYTGEVMTQNRFYYESRGYVETHRAFDHGHHRVYYKKSLEF